MRVVVQAANLQERDGAQLVLAGTRTRFLWLRTVWVDRTERGTLGEWARREAGVDLAVVAPPPGTQGFQVRPRRWVGERSIAGDPLGDGAVPAPEHG